MIENFLVFVDHAGVACISCCMHAVHLPVHFISVQLARLFLRDLVRFVNQLTYLVLVQIVIELKLVITKVIVDRSYS